MRKTNVFKLFYGNNIIGTIETTFWEFSSIRKPTKNITKLFRYFEKHVQKNRAIEKHGFCGFFVPHGKHWFYV